MVGVKKGNFGLIMPQVPISPKLSLERLTLVNKIEKWTAVGIGHKILVGKMQISCQLIPKCSACQTGLKYGITVCSTSISFGVHFHPVLS